MLALNEAHSAEGVGAGMVALSLGGGGGPGGPPPGKFLKNKNFFPFFKK